MAADHQSTIVAPASPQGSGAIAVIRISGAEAIEKADSVFVPHGNPQDSGKSLGATPAYRMRYGAIYDGKRWIDDVVAAVFRAPRSYTGENSVEIYCHGSSYIVREIIRLLLSKGVRMAEPGEFSRRAFLNGKLDLAQAEAVADLIASETSAAHRVAMHQMKGGFSNELKQMRESLLNLAALMELELDFSEEEVEFANRTTLNNLLYEVEDKVAALIESFALGNVIKNGIPVTIAGATNTGKSTLLNTLLGEEKAIVSSIHGTTRDIIEDTINIGGMMFRFIDTAGIRETRETIEIMGIERTYLKMKQASVVIMVLDATRPEYFRESLETLSKRLNKNRQKVIILINKVDVVEPLFGSISTTVDVSGIASYKQSRPIAGQMETLERLWGEINGDSSSTLIAVLPVSAKQKLGINQLKELLVNSQKEISINPDATLVTNIRHYQALVDAQAALDRVEDGLQGNLPTDLVAQDIREALYHLGSIVGEINTEEILGTIFGRFCIGK